MKHFRIQILTLLAFALVSSLFIACQNESSDDTRALARESLATAAPQAAPAQPTAANQPAQPAAPAGPTTTMSFGENTFDFGEIDEGEKVEHIYKFKNTGDEPLVISNAKGSCGCTVPQWPKTPIAPGDSGEILVSFNSKGKPGPQTKKVTITANTDPVQTFLTITGKVKKAEAQTAVNN